VKRVPSWRSAIGAASGILAIVVFLSATAAPPRPQVAQAPVDEVALELDPAQSTVHFAVDSTLHKVHGTFLLKSGEIHFAPGSGEASGGIIVLATSGVSGNNRRDARMHREILETPIYPEVVFRPTQIEGKVARAGASDVKLHGVIALHGHEHDIVASVHAELSGDHWKGIAKFDVPYVQWGIKDASTWLLKVKPVVDVEVEMAGPAKIVN